MSTQERINNELPWSDAAEERYQHTKHIGRRLLAKMMTAREEEILMLKGRISHLDAELAKTRSLLEHARSQNDVLMRQLNAIPPTMRGPA